MRTHTLVPGGAPPAVPEDAHLARFRDLVESRCGLFFGEGRLASLQASVGVRMGQLGLQDPAAYYERLRADSADDEFRKLIHLVTITETCFLRDPAQFRLLRRHVIPSVLAAREHDGTRAVRIWSAGCSSGEEPYSVALTWRDMGLHLTHPGWTVDILGTDLNTDRLEAARRAVYGARAVRNVEAEWLERFFEPSGAQFRLKDDIRRLVRFREGNLTSDRATGAPPGRADIILCKNVSIYFRPEVTRRLVARLYEALNDGGYLVLGHSESLWQMESGFTLVEHDGVFCYQKNGIRDSEGETRQTRRGGPAAAATRGGGGFGARRPQRDGTAGAGGAGSRVARSPRAAMPGTAAPEPSGRYARCLGMLRAGALDRAEAGLRELILASAAFVPARLLLAGLLARGGRYAEARGQAEQVLALNDMDARAHLMLGMIDARAGLTREAVVSLRRALYLDDALALAYFWLGILYRDRGDVDRACGEHLELVRRHEQHTLDFTDEFTSDLTPGQIVHACRQTVRRLRKGA